MSRLYYTRKKIVDVINTLESNNWTVTRDENSHTISRGANSTAEIYTTPGHAPLFDFRKTNKEDCDECFRLFDLQSARRFG